MFFHASPAFGCAYSARAVLDCRMAFAPSLESILLLATGMALGAGGAFVYVEHTSHTGPAEQSLDTSSHGSRPSSALSAAPTSTLSRQNHSAHTQNTQSPDAKTVISPLTASDRSTNTQTSAPPSLAFANAIELESLAIELGDREFTEGSQTDRQIQALFERWSEIDFNAALHFIEYRQWDAAIIGEQDNLANTGLSVLTRLRPDAMLQWAESGLTLGVLSVHGSMVYQQLAQSDPQRALYALIDGQTYQHGSTSRINAIGMVLSQWSQGDPARAWQWIVANNNNGLLDQFQGRILSHWAQREPDTAMAALEELEPSLQTSSLFKHYAVSLVKKDAAKAFTWAIEIEDQLLKEHVLDTVAYHWASAQPNEVVAHLETIADPAIRQQLLRSAGPAITTNMVAMNPLHAIDWTNTLSLDEQVYLKPIVFQSWFQKDADKAVQWLSDHGDPDTNTLYLSNVASTLPYSNLPVAIELFPSLSESLQQDMAGPIALSLYENNDPSVEHWVSALPTEELQNRAKSGLLYASVKDEPVRALELANAYTGNDRHTVLTTAATEVHQQHPGVLEQWLDSAFVSEKERQDISRALIRQPSQY